MAYLSRGICYSNKGENERALTDLSKFIEQQPDDARGYKNRALVYERLGIKEKAAADNERAARF
jgi:Tfp pilus assembly protein PilF